MATWYWRYTNNLVPKYGVIHAILRHIHKCTNRVRGNQTKQDLAGNDGRVILTKKTNQNLLQCGRIIGIPEETSMLAGVLEIRVKCGRHPPNAGDLTGLEPVRGHVKSLHFCERIREETMFLLKFLGTIGTKRLGQQFWIMIWIYL